MIAAYASPRLRDQFLIALETQDRALSSSLALNLIDCTNPLPGVTCDELGLPRGSTYGSAAQRVLSLNSVSSVEATASKDAPFTCDPANVSPRI
jgi:hypothetical protein